MKSLLDISDLSRNDIEEIFLLTDSLINNTDDKPLKNKSIGLIFEKYSTRTRLSFQVAISQLGGNFIDIDFDKLNLKRNETFEDTFKMFDLYLDGIVYRTDNHKKLTNAKSFFKKPLINGLSEKSHPCQIISDIYTLKKRFISMNKLNISWFGDMNNVLFSYFEIINLFPEIELNVFTDINIFNENKNYFPANDKINFFFDLDFDVIKNSSCIMTDVYNSMNDENGDEKEIILKKFQINKKIIDITNSECVFAHCLPANIGLEVTKEVIEGEKSIILEQAKNRMKAQKGILKWLYS
jgi:ornithine carbamoyltransferase